MARSLLEKWSDIWTSWGLKSSDEAREKKRPRRELRLYLPLPVRNERMWVGSLAQEAGQFVFWYSEEFQGRDDLPAIPAFPDKAKKYTSKQLWPFFQARLPSVSRPEIERLIAELKLDRHDTFRLLHELGHKTVSNPYELELQQMTLSHAG